MNITLFRMNTGELVIAHSEKNKQSYSLKNPMEIILRRIPDLSTSMILSPWLPVELIKEEFVEVLNTNIQYTLIPEEKLIKCFMKIHALYYDVISEVKSKFNEKLDSLLEEKADLESMVSDIMSEVENEEDNELSFQDNLSYLNSKVKKIH